MPLAREKYVLTLALIPAFSPREKEKRLPRISRIKPLDGSDRWTNDQKMHPISPQDTSSNPPVGAPQQERAGDLEDEVGQPKDKLRMKFRPTRERLPEHDERVIHHHQD